LFDKLGREVWYEREFNTASGLRRMTLNGIVSNLSSGSYILRISANGDSEQAVISLVK
jgi:hypothetical protein